MKKVPIARFTIFVREKSNDKIDSLITNSVATSVYRPILLRINWGVLDFLIDEVRKEN